MSAVAVAPRAPRRTRSSSEAEMTPEQELELLIAEQQADDIHYVSRPAGVLSYDGPAPSGEGLVSDFIGVGEDGLIITFLPRSEESLFSVNIPHATFDAYNNHRCRCLKCKAFMAAYRARKRAGS